MHPKELNSISSLLLAVLVSQKIQATIVFLKYKWKHRIARRKWASLGYGFHNCSQVCQSSISQYLILSQLQKWLLKTYYSGWIIAPCICREPETTGQRWVMPDHRFTATQGAVTALPTTTSQLTNPQNYSKSTEISKRLPERLLGCNGMFLGAWG